MVADDNPTGFADLSHAWRMFADRRKKDRAEKRGRFNVYRDARRWYARDRGETTVRELLTVMDGG
ncbi:MAG: hypothetical protein KY467_17810 [Gemmatimonadetes bacterium]|nr:hypothetical protein [Gemmatimonadota bacterium]